MKALGESLDLSAGVSFSDTNFSDTECAHVQYEDEDLVPVLHYELKKEAAHKPKKDTSNKPGKAKGKSSKRGRSRKERGSHRGNAVRAKDKDEPAEMYSEIGARLESANIPTSCEHGPDGARVVVAAQHYPSVYTENFFHEARLSYVAPADESAVAASKDDQVEDAKYVQNRVQNDETKYNEHHDEASNGISSSEKGIFSQQAHNAKDSAIPDKNGNHSDRSATNEHPNVGDFALNTNQNASKSLSPVQRTEKDTQHKRKNANHSKQFKYMVPRTKVAPSGDDGIVPNGK